jgi:hypothetical protein
LQSIAAASCVKTLTNQILAALPSGEQKQLFP